MCDLDGESPSVYRKVTRVARKRHRCCACDEAIEPGHVYRYIAGLWDGHFNDFKQCARCALMYEAIVEVLPPSESARLELDCESLWIDVFTVPQPEHLAFLTAAEAQAMLAEARA